MTRLERSWLSYFVADFQLIEQQIDNHLTYRDELTADLERLEFEVVSLRDEFADELSRIDFEISCLTRRKEKLLRDFAEKLLQKNV